MDMVDMDIMVPGNSSIAIIMSDMPSALSLVLATNLLQSLTCLLFSLGSNHLKLKLGNHFNQGSYYRGISCVMVEP